MKIAVFSAKRYDREFLEAANAGRHTLRFLEPQLDEETCSLAAGSDAVGVELCLRPDLTVPACATSSIPFRYRQYIALSCTARSATGLKPAAP